MERELLSWVGVVLSLLCMFAMIISFTLGRKNQKLDWWMHVIILCSYAVLLAKNIFIGETFLWMIDVFIILIWFSSIRSLEKKMNAPEEYDEY